LPSRTGNTYQEPTSAEKPDTDIQSDTRSDARHLRHLLKPEVDSRLPARHLLQLYRKSTPDFRPDINTRHRLPSDCKSTPDFRSVPALPNPTLPSLGDTSPTIPDKYTAQQEVASRHPDVALNVTLPEEPDYRLTSSPDNSPPVYITGSRAFTPVHEDPRPTMGNGVSSDQGNLPAHGKRDVRRAADRKQHDWSELAIAPETNSLLATANSYSSTPGRGAIKSTRSTQPSIPPG